MASIGSLGHSGTIIFQRFGLTPFRKILSPEVFQAAALQSGCQPRRQRLLIPEVVAWLMMYVALQTTSMTQGLLQAWGLIRSVCPHLPVSSVSEEAFCQARGQLTLTFWRTLWNELVRRYERVFGAAQLWKGKWRVLAVDGSDADLPNTPEVVAFFGKPGAVGGNARKPQGKLVGLCSVFTGFCMGFKLLPKRFTEHAAMAHLSRSLRKDDLVLMDRGFFFLRYDLAHPAARRAFPDAHAGDHGAPIARGAVFGSRRSIGCFSALQSNSTKGPQLAQSNHGTIDTVSNSRISAQLAADFTPGSRGLFTGGARRSVSSSLANGDHLSRMETCIEHSESALPYPGRNLQRSLRPVGAQQPRPLGHE